MASTTTSANDLGIKVEPGTRNVSVTPINMSDSQAANGQFSYSSQGVRISVPSQELQRVPQPPQIHDEDSNDAEVSNIDFSQHPSQVNMRTKKKRPSSSSCMTPSGDAVMSGSCPSPNRDRERPMSWEGELSDSEMLVDTVQDRQGENIHSPRDMSNGGSESECGIDLGNTSSRQHLVREQDILNLKYNNISASNHHHQRSHSMNRVSVLSNEIIDARNPPSPLSQHKSLSSEQQQHHHHHHHNQHSPGGIPNNNASSSSINNNAAPNNGASNNNGLTGQSNVEQTIKNIPVNIIPQSLSNKMATDAHIYACKREMISGQTLLTDTKPELPLMVDKLLGGYSLHSTPSNSPLLNRHHKIVSNPSTDSALHSTSVYTHSVYSSPSASPGATRHAPYTPSLSRNNSDASHSSCYSYTSEFSPTHSPIQGRHPLPSHVLYRSEHGTLSRQQQSQSGCGVEGEGSSPDPEGQQPPQGVSRQQLINSPCPICGDKISGFHYGIFSCESCKGFFKRTVQNRKNYVCLRGANCPVTVTTRKKCPACRFDKCLHCGMKLEAIREDRTRGGRSTYQCSYTLSGAASTSSLSLANTPLQVGPLRHASSLTSVNGPSSHLSYRSHQDLHAASLGSVSQMKSDQGSSHSSDPMGIPPLLQEIMDVEHLWQYNETELSRINRGQPPSGGGSVSSPLSNPLLRSAGLPADSNPDFLANLCNIADHRLYKIVKWCKSLPLFKNISIDDQICLLINSWCELLILSCCYRGVNTPGEVKVSGGTRGITLEQSAKMGLAPCIERMLHFTDHLRRLRVDRYEYVAMKVIVLLTSDTPELKEPEKVRASQEKALQALQAYTLAHYPETPAKFGELLLRIPELQRTCQVGKEMLNPSNKSKDGEAPSFNLLMELLRGDH